jgi:hypothetical protein
VYEIWAVPNETPQECRAVREREHDVARIDATDIANRSVIGRVHVDELEFLRQRRGQELLRQYRHAVLRRR